MGASAWDCCSPVIKRINRPSSWHVHSPKKFLYVYINSTSLLLYGGMLMLGEIIASGRVLTEAPDSTSVRISLLPLFCAGCHFYCKACQKKLGLFSIQESFKTQWGLAADGGLVWYSAVQPRRFKSPWFTPKGSTSNCFFCEWWRHLIPIATWPTMTPLLKINQQVLDHPTSPPILIVKRKHQGYGIYYYVIYFFHV